MRFYSRDFFYEINFPLQLIGMDCTHEVLDLCLLPKILFQIYLFFVVLEISWIHHH
jgi:hypothetical protein